MASAFPRIRPGPSIHEFIRDRLDPTGRLPSPVPQLPDSPTGHARDRWVAGATDALLAPAPAADGWTSRVTTAVVVAGAGPSAETLEQLYRIVRDAEALSHMDAVLHALSRSAVDRDAVHAVGRWLATTAVDREAVEVGIALLGATGPDRALDVLLALGAHDEFTMFVATAMADGLAEPDRQIRALAERVQGWGRIQCVRRLRATTDPTVRDWILRGGYRNAVHDGELAHIAATTGGLLAALRTGPVDRELLTAAGEILGHLVDMHEIGAYPQGADAVEAFLDHMHLRAENLRDCSAVEDLLFFLEDEDEDWPVLGAGGWTPQRRETYRARCAEILGRPEWDDRITEALSSTDPREFRLATLLAQGRGIDTFEQQLDRIHRDPFHSQYWDHALHEADAERADRVVRLARELLPPADPDDPRAGERRAVVDTFLQWQQHRPGVGADIVRAALEDPQTALRAVHVLARWPADQWPDGARDRLIELSRAAADERTRRRAAETLDLDRGAVDS